MPSKRRREAKGTLQALVKTHFMQKLAQDTQHFDYDIVRGKGRGLVVLLHGPPGVGKTFTAEPKEVDHALKEIFHYAQHWKCVLLLDECDVFLTQRTPDDVKRNALVSVFLRVLEFYTGVLFLTTNRVGTLDEAIKSRITWIMYYPPLNWVQTREIWKTNIKRVERGNNNLDVDKDRIIKFARQQYKTSLERNIIWNGRRIQNAFKVAVAMAFWDVYTKDERENMQLTAPAAGDVSHRANLTVTHFRTYAKGTHAFDTYLEDATGFNDNDRAFQARERADDHQHGFEADSLSPRYEVSMQPHLISIADESRRTSTTPRPISPRPPSSPRLSSSQLLQHRRSSTFARTTTVTNPAPQPHASQRRYSQLGTSPPVHRRPANEHRLSVDSGLDQQQRARGFDLSDGELDDDLDLAESSAMDDTDLDEQE